MRGLAIVVCLVLLLNQSSGSFFSRFLPQKQKVKGIPELELSTVGITKQFLDDNRLLVVGCAVLLRRLYDLNHQSIANGLSHALIENNTSYDINEKYYVANLENCLTHISEDAAQNVIQHRKGTKTLDKMYGKFFITSEKNIRKFIADGIELSANQVAIRNFLQTDLDGEYSQVFPFFDKVISQMNIRKAKKEKSASSEPVYVLDFLKDTKVIFGLLAIIVLVVMCLVSNENKKGTARKPRKGGKSSYSVSSSSSKKSKMH